MTTAFVFPGQGSQTPGMGRVFYNQWPETQQQFDALVTATEQPLRELCFKGEADQLQSTLIAQPALFATGLSVAAGAVDRLGSPAFVAGHSLGHITALTAAEALAPTDAFGLVHRRAELMHAAAQATPSGTMLAVLLVDPDVVTEVCSEYTEVRVAGFNAPQQTVVSGPAADVSTVRATLASQTRARFRELDVATAFHSPAMSPAVDPFSAALKATPFRSTSIPVCSDVSTVIYTDPATARADLREQITASIDWVGVIETLVEQGVDHVIEFPPAGTLTDLTERIAPAIDVTPLTTPEDISAITDDQVC